MRHKLRIETAVIPEAKRTSLKQNGFESRAVCCPGYSYLRYLPFSASSHDLSASSQKAAMQQK